MASRPVLSPTPGAAANAPETDHCDPACVLLGLSSAAASAHPDLPSPKRDAQSAFAPPASTAGSKLKATRTDSADSASRLAADLTRKSPAVSALPRKEWSTAEDELIRNCVTQMGCRWRLIAAQLPGRSDDAVRNRWSRLQEAEKGPGAPSRRSSGGGHSTPNPGGASAGGGAAGGSRETRGANRSGGSGGGSGGGGSGGGGSGGGSGGGGVSSGGGGSGGDGKEKKERTSWTKGEDDVIVQGAPPESAPLPRAPPRAPRPLRARPNPPKDRDTAAAFWRSAAGAFPRNPAKPRFGF